MIRRAYISILLATLCIGWQSAELLPSMTSVLVEQGVVFAPTPNGELSPQELILREIRSAKVSIQYQMYNFSSGPIADALIDAHRRGVRVELLLDYVAAHQKSSQASACVAAGIPVYVDRSHPIAHNKVRIFDGKLLLAGSYNDSARATKNAENLTRDTDPERVAAFVANFESHKSHAMTWQQMLAFDREREKSKQRSKRR